METMHIMDRGKGQMRTLEANKAIVKKMQKIVFGIMCDVDDFCKENEIRYYLSGGTCLGAVRHKGFIPWDDDGDLMMPRPDYEKFLRLFPAYCKGKYGVGSLLTDSDWVRPFARICDLNSNITPIHFTERSMGVFVDLFPIDGLPKGRISKWKHYRHLRVLSALRNTSVRTKSRENERFRCIKNATSVVTKHIGARWFAERMDKRASKYLFDNSREVAAILALHYWDKETIHRENVETASEFLFEGRMFPVPIGYRQYLSNLYGEYMTMPEGAEEKGYTHLDGWIVEFAE